jgi:hypothetical protein
MKIDGLSAMSGVMGGILIGTIAISTLDSLSGKNIPINPTEREMEQNCVNPKDITFKFQDQDNDGLMESVVNVEGKPYLMMYDSNKKPILSEYEVTPSGVEVNQNP